MPTVDRVRLNLITSVPINFCFVRTDVTDELLIIH